VRIGIVYADPTTTKAAAGIGAKGASVGDPKAYATAIIADLNARGGINGRKIQPFWYADDVTGAEQSQQMTAACEGFMSDSKVVAVVGLGHPALADCVERRGGITVDATFGVSGLDAAGFSQFPHYANVSALALDRAARDLVSSLVSQGYFSGWNTTTGSASTLAAKVGVISYDDVYFKRVVNQVLLPELQRAGHPSVVTEFVNHHQSLSDLSGQVTQVQSAVLKMASSGVTHIVDFDDNGTIGLFFLNTAEGQGYRPRYGVTTGSEFNYLVTSGTSPERQFRGAMGIGWHELLDVPVSDWLSGANASRRRCAAALKAAGQAPAPGFEQTTAAGLCDALGLLQVALSRAPSVGQAGFASALQGLGAAFQSAATPGTRFDLRRRDGAAMFRTWQYKPSCTCMAYTSRGTAT
jgi:hypothetical protein